MNKSERYHDHHAISYHTKHNQSFSSTLLDAIYRSIDEASDDNLQQESHISGKRRTYLVDQWMEEKVTEKIVWRKPRNNDSLFINSNSSSSSSDSSSGAVFSSELESVSGSRPKPIRTSVIQLEKSKKSEKSEKSEKSKKSDVFDKNCIQIRRLDQGGFVKSKTKSRALKMYSELKKASAKQLPISPGGRLASFINSLFTAGNTNKAKSKTCSSASARSSYAYEDDRVNLGKISKTSTCSSASSFSRSCMSKPQSKSSYGTKRSVHFYSDSSQSCGRKSFHDEERQLRGVKVVRSSMENNDLKFHLAEKNRKVEAARELLKKYQMNVESEVEIDDDDRASCASSDLFELENLSGIGMEMYHEELPVYETTHFDTNRAITNRMIM